ncbi:MAG: hypothetical protein Q4D44_02465 [Eubacteriales bacterium]|nr:hypothetical protein [Eubacteriales bacterium]
MDNLESAIGNILSNPEAMSKISELSKSLGLTSNNPPQASQSNNQGIDLSAISGLLGGLQSSSPPQNPLSSLTSGGISPELLSTVSKFLPLIRDMNREDESTVLLNALRPFLSGDKCRRLDEAQRMLRIMRILPALRGTGLLNM